MAAVENPGRLSFVGEMVDRERLRNAVTLNTTMVNVARAVGPAIAGVLVVAVGIGACFLVNAASFAAVVMALATLDGSNARWQQVAPGRGRPHGGGCATVFATPAGGRRSSHRF